MKLPYYHGFRTNKTVRKSFVMQKDREQLTTRYTNCEKCSGKGEVIFAPDSHSCFVFATQYGDKIYEEQLCKSCTEPGNTHCKICYGNGYTDFVECNECYGTGLNGHTPKYYKMMYRVANKKKQMKEKGYMRCFDCGTRICKNVIWMREDKHNSDKKIYYDDIY